MPALWTGEAMAAAMGGRPLGELPHEVSGISIDTRTLAAGDAFFAIRGDRFDGHDFATAAIAAGASLLVVAEGKLPALGRVTRPMIVVDDVLKALERLGAAARARTRAKVVAITGSAGKTSTKEALRLALAACGAVHAADKSFNNHWGVPLTLARTPADADFAIYEIGMNHAGEIRSLVGLVRPDIAIVTLIAAAHLGHFHSLDDIARAKGEIFEGVVPGGHALINRDDARWRILEKLAKEAGVKQIVGFGENARSQVRLMACTLDDAHSDIVVRVGGREISARIGAPGRHVAQNALAVLGAAHLAGADVERAAAALADLRAEKGRGQRHVLRHGRGEFVLIDESYNANPTSMKAAIDLLAAAKTPPGGRRIAVLGDMLELGAQSKKLHAGLAETLVDAGIDLALLAGPDMKALAEALPESIAKEYRQGAAELSAVLMATVAPGDVVMVKSSNGSGFSKLVEALLQEFAAPRRAAAG